MKDWKMIHKIKALYDDGDGLGVRAIGRELRISRNTVRKYLRLSETEVADQLNKKERIRILDQHRDHVTRLLQNYPNLSAVKVRRKLVSQGLSLDISDRSIRRYVKKLKETVTTRRKRYYEPVLDMLPGVQCQVDPGELRNVMVGDTNMSVYFIVFVLSYSRQMYVHVSDKPIDTREFILAHNEAFSYFGGRPEECVYDQTKLVVIKEENREVLFNEMFYQYATTVGFAARVCKGYDPESKGRVEAGVKYVKGDFFYGDTFSSLTDLKDRAREWLDTVANQRVHGTTREIPAVVWRDRELSKLSPYLRPAMELFHPKGEFRKVDKTSLISYKSVKYSVPTLYQSSRVIVKESENALIIHSPDNGQEIARHKISVEKGAIVKNRNHYRDYQADIKAYEGSINRLLGEGLGVIICQRLKKGFPRHYKDQLEGLKKLLRVYEGRQGFRDAMENLTARASLRVSYIRDYLEAFYAPEKETTEDFERLGAYVTGSLSSYASLGGLTINT